MLGRFQGILIRNHYKKYIFFTIFVLAMKSRWMGWVVDVRQIRDEKCIHSCAEETLKGRELVGLLADEWQDNVKEIWCEDVV
jgi:hypothetical protein